jgi:hypothetical protein
VFPGRSSSLPVVEVDDAWDGSWRHYCVALTLLDC